MTITSRFLGTVVLVAALLVAAGPAQAATGGWTASTAQYVGGQNFLLNAVTAPAAGDVWAVGYRYEYVGGALEFRTVIEHGSAGGAFQMVPSPDREGAPATNFLQDVSGASSSDVWAVGWSRNPGQPSRTLVEHWDGSTWSIATSADPGLYGNELDGVVALGADDVWAVGARQDSFYQSPVAQHWDGSTWTASAVPNPTYCTGHSYLTDVARVGATKVWAVGWCQSSSHGEQGYAMWLDGTRWRIAHHATAGIPQNSELYGISATGRHGIWVAGLTRDGGALAMRWDGTAWETPAGWTGQTATSLSGVLARYPRVAWAVGAGPSGQPPWAGPSAVRFLRGDTTTRQVNVDYGSLRGIGYDPAGRIWAVGTQLPGQYNTPLIVSRPAH